MNGQGTELHALPRPPSIELHRQQWRSGELVDPLSFEDYLVGNTRMEGIKELYEVFGQEAVDVVENFLGYDHENRPPHALFPAIEDKVVRRQVRLLVLHCPSPA